MAQVDILLAAYNGEKYIAEQIDSLLAQTFKDIRIVIRDDGSSDRTPEIIEQYAKKYPDIIEVVHDDAVCKYHAANFFQLLKYAKADYVMFCDQDDYWLKWKIEITMDYMKKTERDNPGRGVLVFTGLQLVDEKLQSLDEFMALNFEDKKYSFSELLKVNAITGCTVMINRQIYENIGEYADYIDYHDYWLALRSSVFDVMCYVPMALILYRRHEHNATPFKSRKNKPSKIVRLINLFKNLHEELDKDHKIFENARRRCIGFRERYRKSLTAEQLQQIDEILKLYSNNVITRLRAMIKNKIIQYWGKLAQAQYIMSIITYKPGD